MDPWIVGVTGASGVRYALRLIEVLSHSARHGSAVGKLHVVFSEAALRVLAEEEELKVSMSSLMRDGWAKDGIPDGVVIHHPNDIAASIASGSFRSSGMFIIPCSMNTLGRLAHGVGGNLILRAADVVLKEQLPLIVVPRETPLSKVHLENMLRVSDFGARIVPAMPGFYHRPQTVNELVDMLVMKVLDSAGLRFDLTKRWGDSQESVSVVGDS